MNAQRNVTGTGIWRTALAAGFLLMPWAGARAAARQALSVRVPKASSPMLGDLGAARRLNLCIGLPLRNRKSLEKLLKEIYDPASPRYHHFLSPEQFRDEFGPTQSDYQAVKDFAKAQGLSVSATYGNRMLVDVSGPVADIHKAFHVTLRSYRRPDGSSFHAPDRQPWVDLSTPVLAVGGLQDEIRPQPRLHQMAAPPRAAGGAGRVGSGWGGSYFGYDFRKAYLPNVTLTGSGQTLALVEFGSGFYPSDITSYQAQAGLPAVPVQPVLLDGYDGGPGGENAEVSLDIEMAMSMAPGLSRILVYEGFNTNSILNRIATDDLAKQISISWGFWADDTSKQIILQYAAQGQTVFLASGDNGAWSSSNLAPLDGNPYITMVGGTTLSTLLGGHLSEKTWNWGMVGSINPQLYASGGGINPNYALPSYQQGIATADNQASDTYRDGPDVACVADNIWVFYNGGYNGFFGGTSASAPLWAGVMALVNQQVTSLGRPAVGFINPTLYSLAKSPAYAGDFFDVRDNSDNGTYHAVAGYDLCTGWGSPRGWGIINDLGGVVRTPTPTVTPTLTSTPQSGCHFNTAKLPDLVLGQADFNSNLFNRGGAPAADTLAQPNFAFTDGTILLVSDMNNSRVLLYRHLPGANGAAPDVVIGQPDFTGNNCNQGGSPGPNTLCGPQGVFWDGSRLYIADSGNNRVLIYDGIPASNNASASVVVGQPDFHSTAGGQGASAGDLWQPMDARSDGTRLVVSDSGYNRVLVYNHIPTANGAAANVVIGQADMTQGSVAGGDRGVTAPKGLALSNGRLFVATARTNPTTGNSEGRVFIYNTIPSSNNALADVVVGDTPYEDCSPSYLGGWTASGIATDGTRLFITGSTSRVMIYNRIPTAGGAACDEVLGQPDLWTCTYPQPTGNGGLAGPMGLALSPDGGTLFVADGGNNRVLRYTCQGGPAPTATPTPGQNSAGPGCRAGTAAGHGVAGFSGDGGPATAAAMTQSWGLGSDAAGNFYFADLNNNRVRRVDAAGVVSTVAGNGSFGVSGDGGAATAARLRQPWDVKADSAGNLYILDFGANNVRKVNPQGVITTVLGSPSGEAGNSQNGLSGTSTLLRQPTGLAVDARGDVFVVDAGNAVVRVLWATSGICTTVAGTPGQFGFGGDGSPMGGSLINPSSSTLAGIVADTSGAQEKLYFSDANNHRIRVVGLPYGSNKYTIVNTLAGTGVPGNGGDGGAATAATFTNLQGLALDGCGGLLVSDSDSQRIRRIDLATGLIGAFAGRGAGGFSGDGGPASLMAFNNPEAMAVLPGGEVVVMDRSNLRVRSIAACQAGCPAAGMAGRGEESASASELRGAEGRAPSLVGPEKPLVVAPNPARDSVKVMYYLEEGGKASLEVYTLDGVKVAQLGLGEEPAGAGSADFDTSRLASGLYLAVLMEEGRSGTAARARFKFAVLK